MSKPNDHTDAVSRASGQGAGAQGGPATSAPTPRTAETPRPFKDAPRIQAAPEPARPVARPGGPQPVRQVSQPIPVRPVPPPAEKPQQAVALRQETPVPARAPAAPPPEPVRPTVATAYARRRHWLLLISFLVMVVLPTIFWGWYLWARASDQYVSTVGFSVRKQDTTPSIDLLGGLGSLGGGSGASDTDILYEYIRSQDMVEKVDAKLNLRSKFSRDWPHDYIFAFDPEGHVEDLTDYWQRQVKVLYDTTSDLITMRINAFSPEDAQEIASAAFAQASDKINELSAIAQEDSMRLATEELEKTREDLTETRQAMTDFRMRSLIVDPTADLTSQMGVLSGLQAQLAEALVAHDVLLDSAKPSDHRVVNAQQKIDALRSLIESERGKFGADGQGANGESYSKLMAEYEKLMVDREFAEGAYRSARIAYETAMAEARRKSRYLAAHIEPKVAQSSTVPNRPWLLFMVAGMLLAGWSILTLVYYSIRDRA